MGEDDVDKDFFGFRRCFGGRALRIRVELILGQLNGSRHS